MSYFLIYKLSLAFYLLMITVNQYNSTQGPEKIHGTVFTRLDPFLHHFLLLMVTTLQFWESTYLDKTNANKIVLSYPNSQFSAIWLSKLLDFEKKSGLGVLSDELVMIWI